MPRFEPENELELALMQAASDPSRRAGFARILMDAEIVVALLSDGSVPVQGIGGKTTLPVGTKLKVAVATHDDRAHITFFTAPSRARVWCDRDHILAPDKTRDLFARNTDTPHLLNPGSDYGKEFTVAEVRRLLAGRFEAGPRTIVFDDVTEMSLAHPSEPPKALLAALMRELGGIEAVHGAWLMLASKAGDSEQTWMLGVENGGDWRDVQKAVGRAVRGDVLRGKFLDVKATDAGALSTRLRAGIPILRPKRNFLARLFR